MRTAIRLARTAGPGTGNPYETNESPRTPEETTPLFVGERIGSSPHAGAGKVPASRSRSTRSPITAAVRLRTRRQRCPDLGSLFFSPDVSLVQWRGWRGGSNDQRRGAGLEIRGDARGSMCLTCDYSFPCLIWAGDSGMVSLRGRVKMASKILSKRLVLILIPSNLHVTNNRFTLDQNAQSHCMPQKNNNK